MRRGQRPFWVVRPKISGDSSEVLRDGVDDLTPRAENFTRRKHAAMWITSMKNGDRFWWTQIGTHFAKQFTKELKEVSGEELYHHHRDMSKAVKPKKQVRVRRQAMKAPKDRRDESYDSARKKHVGKETDKTGVVGRTSQKTRS